MKALEKIKVKIEWKISCKINVEGVFFEGMKSLGIKKVQNRKVMRSFGKIKLRENARINSVIRSAGLCGISTSAFC